MSLLILIVCICLFSASCIYASDVDEDLAINQSTIDIDDLNAEKEDASIIIDDDQNDVDLISCDASNQSQETNLSEAQISIINTHSVIKTTDSIDLLENNSLSKINPLHLYHNDVCLSMPGDDLCLWNSQANTDIQTKNVYNKLSDNDFNSISINYDSKLIKDDEFCLNHGKCNHNLNTDIGESIYDDGDNLSNDLTYSYNMHYSTQINTNRCNITLPRTVEDEKIIILRNNNFKNLLTLNNNQYLNQTGFNDDLNDNNITRGDMFNNDLNNDCHDLFYINVIEFNFNALKLTLNSSELGIKDYNMEYYIFSNPYIIVRESNFNMPITNTLTFNNHCLSAKISLNSNNSIYDVNQKLSTCTVRDNYESINNTVFCENTAQLFCLRGANHIKFINDNIFANTTYILSYNYVCHSFIFGGKI